MYKTHSFPNNKHLILMANTATPEQKIQTPAPDLANIPYGPHKRNVLDFWRSRGNGPAPLILYIHGGGFRGGDKTSIPATILNESLKSGHAVAAINYRLSNEVTFPTFMLDSARALQFLRSKAKEWNINSHRIAATGGSAGGGISLWLAFRADLADPGSSDPISRESTHLTCMGLYNTQCSYDPRFYRANGLAPAADHPFMPPFYGLTYEQMDTPEAHQMFEDAAAINWLHAGGPPLFLYYTHSPEPLPADAKSQPNWTPTEIDLPAVAPLQGWAVHHPKMGKLMKEKLDNLGVECELHLADKKEQVPGVQTSMVEFMTRHLLKK
jgi:acetyl esterase